MSEKESKRVLVQRLLYANREWVQWHVEDAIGDLPGYIVKPMMLLLKTRMKMDKEQLWALPILLLQSATDEQFDKLCQFLVPLLTDAPEVLESPESPRLVNMPPL